MVIEGFANDADVCSRFDAEARRPWLFPALSVALGRRGEKED
jgi:hypothetical protein